MLLGEGQRRKLAVEEHLIAGLTIGVLIRGLGEPPRENRQPAISNERSSFRVHWEDRSKTGAD